MFSFEISVPGQNVCFCFGLCYDSLFSAYPQLPDMKQIGTQTHRAAAMGAGKQTGSTVLDSTCVFETWRQLRAWSGVVADAT